jgi:hypothetical protein
MVSPHHLTKNGQGQGHSGLPKVSGSHESPSFAG